MSLEEALGWTRIFLSWSVFLQGLEMLRLKAAWADHGPWSWNNLKTEYRGFSGLEIFLNERGFSILLRLQIMASFISLFFPSSGLLAFMWVSVFFVSLRWRGNFNGGSDAMTLHSLGALVLASVGGDHQSVVRVALTYLVVQVCLSYVIAGVVKLKHPRWRSGRILEDFFVNSDYLIPQKTRDIFKNNFLSRPLAWSILFFECTFFTIFLSHQIAFIYLAIGFAFHLVNFFVLGLNRFFWTWIATYPMLFYFCQ